MANLLKFSGLASALLALAALLTAGACADSNDVTTAECKVPWEGGYRVRRYPTDSDATYLEMWDCGLTEINQGYQYTFTGLPNLKVIALQENHIENLNTTAFHTVPTLKKLWLQHNKLRTLPVFDERSCPNLTELLVYNNKLTAIENERTFSACVKLEEIDLRCNKIEFIHPNVFKPLINLRILHLEKNMIRSISDQMFVSNGKLEELHLNNNRITHLSPNFASSLKRAAAGLLVFYFYDNPWRCACLLELMADVQRTGVIYYNWHIYGGFQPVCVYSGAVPCRPTLLPHA